MRKFLYLINPISGTKKKSLLKKTIEQKTSAKNIPFEITETRRDANYSFLKEKILSEKITDVVICGGDGSVSTITSFLLDVPVNIGIIPTGSGNGLAFAAGIPYSTTRALDIIFAGSPAFVDGFWINDKFSCMMCGIGCDAQVAHEFANRKVRGLKTYLQLSAMHFFKAKPFNFTIKTKDFSTTVDAFFITISNSNQFGNNITIAPKASLSDGRFDIVIVKKMHKLMLPFALLRQISGNNTIEELKNYRNNKNIVYFQASEATIVNNSNAPLHIDGEPEPFTENIKLKILPNAFRLLQPSV
ncbi:MAG: YegS/Rv2252/BmrU family lipid kinase [Chitinophagaceae bacterium]|nr:YegS/Rv2252/BmrU family lipid kinase [Chitinophagaceae bacterium]